MRKLEEMVNLVKELKAYAVTELGISENPSFQSVEEGGMVLRDLRFKNRLH